MKWGSPGAVDRALTKLRLKKCTWCRSVRAVVRWATGKRLTDRHTQTQPNNTSPSRQSRSHATRGVHHYLVQECDFNSFPWNIAWLVNVQHYDEMRQDNVTHFAIAWQHNEYYPKKCTDIYKATTSGVSILRPPRGKPINVVLSLLRSYPSLKTVLAFIRRKTENGLKSEEHVMHATSAHDCFCLL